LLKGKNDFYGETERRSQQITNFIRILYYALYKPLNKIAGKNVIVPKPTNGDLAELSSDA